MGDYCKEVSDMGDQQTFQFFAELRDTEIEPKIWRRFQVDGHATFADLAYVVMTLFEMRGEHLFAFRLSETEIDGSKADQIHIDEMIEVRKPFTMLYDFGDSWEVQLCMESKEIGDGTAPKVLNGEGYGIIENCAGAPMLSRYTGALPVDTFAFDEQQYKKFVRTYKKELDLAWFDLDYMNARLKEIPQILRSQYHPYPCKE